MIKNATIDYQVYIEHLEDYYDVELLIKADLLQEDSTFDRVRGEGYGGVSSCEILRVSAISVPTNLMAAEVIESLNDSDYKRLENIVYEMFLEGEL